MKNSRLYAGIALGGLFLYFVVLPLIPARTVSARSVEEDAQITYICTETNKVIVGLPQQLPAINPEMGKRTLARALYCSQCKKWRPAPSPDAFPGNPLSLPCPRHHIPMTTEQPVE